MDWVSICFTTGSLFLACMVGYGYTGLQNVLTGSATWGSITRDVVLCVALLVLSGVLFDVARLKPSRHHTLKSLLSQYILFKILPFLAFLSKRRCRVAIDQIKQTQVKLLLDIVHHNTSTRYGRDHKFNEVRGIEDFRAVQPLTDYTYYKGYINDILNGQDNVLFADKVDFIATSSGTSSGISKVYPFSLKTLVQQFRDTSILNRNRITYFPGMNHLKFWHKVTIHSPWNRRTQSGIPLNAVSGFVGPIFPFYASPPVVYKVNNEPDALYLHALFGIRNEDVILLEFLTAPVALNFVRTIEKNWESLCTDLEQGILNRNIGIDPSLRFHVEKELHKDIQRARHLRSIFSEGFHDLIPRIWPSCKFVKGVASGTFSFAAETLKRNYLGNVHLYSATHIASEGIYGMNLDLISSTGVRYTIVPSFNFYEFIPVKEMDCAVPKTVLADGVEVGGEYELVVTTRAGLYRYRTADIVRVTGFQRQTPSYMFIQRAGDMLSVNLDKYPESTFTEAVTAAAETWTSGSLLNYIATESIHVEHITGEKMEFDCYYVFVELLEDGCQLSQKEKAQIDESLKEKEDNYRLYRTKRRCLNPAVVIQIENGSIQHVRDILLRENTKAVTSQYKYPRFIRNQTVLQYLLSHQVK